MGNLQDTATHVTSAASVMHIALIAGLSACIIVYLVRSAALRLQLFDGTGELKIHKRPTPRLGGIGLTLGMLVGISAIGLRASPHWLYLLAGCLTIWLVSLVDDLRGLAPVTRLIFHLGAALLTYMSGLSPYPGAPGVVSAALTCVYVVAFVNAFNFLDGCDGLAGGMSALMAAGYLFMFVSSAPSLALIAVSVSAACIGFLFYNFPPATIFMGDSGSTVLGLTFAVLGLEATRLHGAAGFAMGLLIPAIPLVDMVHVMLRRTLRGHSILSGDRSHFYDLLLQRGLSSRGVAFIGYAGVVLCVAAASLLPR